MLAAFRRGLNETGYVVDQNVRMEIRFGSAQYDQLAALAADLVRRQVAVIVTGGGENPALAAKSATTKIPIVFTVGDDPVRSGLVASLNRPGGNITGVSTLFGGLGTKQLGLLRELLPKADLIAMLVNPKDFWATSYTATQRQQLAPSASVSLSSQRVPNRISTPRSHCSLNSGPPRCSSLPARYSLLGPSI